MKFTWGWGIGIFYVSFMAIILGVVFYSTFHKQDLVVDNYYEEDLAYQEQIDKLNRTKALPEKVKMLYKKDELTVEIPASLKDQISSGKVKFFRPSDKALDQEMDLEINKEQMIIDVKDFTKGYWKVQVDWIMNDSSYFVENKFFF